MMKRNLNYKTKQKRKSTHQCRQLRVLLVHLVIVVIPGVGHLSQLLLKEGHLVHLLLICGYCGGVG